MKITTIKTELDQTTEIFNELNEILNKLNEIYEGNSDKQRNLQNSFV